MAFPQSHCQMASLEAAPRERQLVAVMDWTKTTERLHTETNIQQNLDLTTSVVWATMRDFLGFVQ